MKTPTKSFRIKQEYLTDVPTNNHVRLEMNDGTIIEGNAFSNIDHPKFTELRNKLENLGFIRTERMFWNGDRVLKPFKLNGVAFKPGDQFSCASALRIRFTVAKKIKTNK